MKPVGRVRAQWSDDDTFRRGHDDSRRPVAAPATVAVVMVR
jgi:hypothetical protein